MWPRFGIKIGNSTLCIAVVKSGGNPEVIANKQGDRVSQACLLAEGSEIECGLTAKQKMSSKPASCVCNSLQFFLSQSVMTPEKIQEMCKYITCYYNEETKEFELKSKSGGDADKEIVTKISPHQVCVKFYKAEYELARQSYLDDKSKPNVVLSIPSSYPTESWAPLAAAAEEAGFHVSQVITEMTAAVVAYGIGENQKLGDPTKIVLGIKSGGIYSQFTLFQVVNGLYTVVKDVGPFTIGGNQYTEALVEFISQEFYKKYRLDPKESRRSMAKIYTAATNCKHILTALPSTQIHIDSLMDGVDFSMLMSRARFESLIQPDINKFMATLNEALKMLNTQGEDMATIHEIVLAGASMKIPKIQAAISSQFPEAILHTKYAADEVVAIGCARQASYLTNPAAQILSERKHVIMFNSDVFIWHGKARDNATIVVRYGTIMPCCVVVEVEKAKEEEFLPGEDENMHVFNLLTKGKVLVEMKAIGTVSANGKFKLEVNMDKNGDDGRTTVQIKCL